MNLGLTALWVLMLGSTNIWTMASGFLLGFVILQGIGHAVSKPGEPVYGSYFWRLLRFTLYFIKILFEANWQVAREVITPGFSLEPRLIRYDVTGLNDVQLTSLANAITLTPGTLVVDVSDDRPDGTRLLYIHCMFAADRAAAVAALDELRDKMKAEVFS